MATSTITVAGINPLLNILGSSQQFIFGQNISNFKLNTTFLPTSSIASETDFEITNCRLSGFRWAHLTTSTDTHGTLIFQSFINAQSTGSGSNFLKFDSTGINGYTDLYLNGNNIIGATWLGNIIAVAHGGTGVGSVTPYAVLCGGTTSTGSLQAVSGLGTTGQVLTSQGAGALPIWSPVGGGTITSIATGTGLTGGPITSSGTISLQTPVSLTNGGTGIGSATPYAVLCGGTTSTGALQSLSSIGTSGQVLTSQGAASLPTWNTPTTGTVTSIATGTGLTGGPITSTGTIKLDTTGVTAASYSYPTITINAQGQITAASNNTPVTSITTGTGLTGGPITSTGTIALQTPVSLANGGTGIGSATPYAVLCGGTTSTGVLQPLASLGTTGQVLTSQGAASLPTWSTPTTGTVTSIATGQGLTGGPITATGTISLQNTTVTPSTYSYATITVNQQGQITGASTSTGQIYMASAAVPSAPSVANDGIYSVNLGKAKFTSGTTIDSGTIVTASTSTGNATVGNGTLNGTTGVTISTTAIQTTSIVNVTRNNGTSGAPAGTSLGHLSVASIVAGTSFKVYSTNSADTFPFSWLIINP